MDSNHPDNPMHEYIAKEPKTLKGKWKLDPNNPAGPRQVGAWKKAYSDFNWTAGEHGREEADGKVFYFRLLIGGAWSDGAYDIMNRIGEHFNWTLSRVDIGQVTTMLIGAIPELKACRPVSKYLPPSPMAKKLDNLMQSEQAV